MNTDLLAKVVERGKREIQADILAGDIPATVSSFSELHNFVDANGYGGAFENNAPHRRDTDTSTDEDLQFDADFWNAAQDAMDEWIKAGGHKPCPECGCPMSLLNPGTCQDCDYRTPEKVAEESAGSIAVDVKGTIRIRVKAKDEKSAENHVLDMLNRKFEEMLESPAVLETSVTLTADKPSSVEVTDTEPDGNCCPECGGRSFRLNATFGGTVDVTFAEDPDGDLEVDDSNPGDSEWDGPAHCFDCGWDGDLSDLVETPAKEEASNA